MCEWRYFTGFTPCVRVNRAGEVHIRDENGDWKSCTPIRAGKSGNMYAVRVYGRDGRRRVVPVSRLVAAAFLGGVKPGDCVMHINGDKADNRVENLRIGNRKDAGHLGGLSRPKRPVKVIDERGEVLERYGSIRAAAKAYGTNEARMKTWCVGRGINPHEGKRFALE